MKRIIIEMSEDQSLTVKHEGISNAYEAVGMLDCALHTMRSWQVGPAIESDDAGKDKDDAKQG